MLADQSLRSIIMERQEKGNKAVHLFQNSSIQAKLVNNYSSSTAHQRKLLKTLGQK